MKLHFLEWKNLSLPDLPGMKESETDFYYYLTSFTYLLRLHFVNMIRFLHAQFP